MQRYFGYVEQGGVEVEITGTDGSSPDVFQQSYPLATITVYNTGTLTLSTIYSDDGITPKANPFTADANGYFFFYAANGVYDVKFSGGAIPSPYTYSGVGLFDAGALLIAIAALATNGLITRTSSSTAAARTITAGSANISITNGNGVSGNPTIDLGTTLTGITISGASNTLTVLAGSQLTGEVPLANGGTGASLADPGADRIMFWDDSAGAITFLTVGSGLSITTTTISATAGGSVTGTGTANTLAKWSAASVLTDSGIIDDGTTIELARDTRIVAGELSINGDFAAQAQLHLKTTASAQVWEETDAAADEKPWLWDMTAGVLALKTLTDAYGAGATALTIDRTGTALLFIAAQTRLLTKQGANVVAGNDLTLGTDGNFFVVTGNTQVNAITTANWQAGSEITLKFTGTPTVKNNTAGGAGTATLLLSLGIDFTASATCTLKLVYDGTNWNEVCRSVNHA